jgi:spermidine/putrescine transport system ATP-binding protein
MSTWQSTIGPSPGAGAAETEISAPEIAVEARGVSKVFGADAGRVTALDNVFLTIRHNEFFTLLGPSGCGKTTLLRAIAGFEELSAGEILLFGRSFGDLPPNRRPVNMVFQQYALFPHMTVAENVAFGLRRLRQKRAAVDETVARMLDLVKLGALAHRRPSQLSGGQQQRVALARALAPHPKVLLLDEPLSALDLKLRQEMRVELKQLQEQTGITFVFVTHDQEEALAMSDRIAVLSEGRIQQVGTARDIYDHPRNRFVAGFIGETNLLEVEVLVVTDGTALCRGPAGLKLSINAAEGCSPGGRASLSIRPERIALHPAGGSDQPTAVVERAIFLGNDTQYLMRLGEQRLLARIQNSAGRAQALAIGERVALSFDSGAARMLAD